MLTFTCSCVSLLPLDWVSWGRSQWCWILPFALSSTFSTLLWDLGDWPLWTAQMSSLFSGFRRDLPMGSTSRVSRDSREVTLEFIFFSSPPQQGILITIAHCISQGSPVILALSRFQGSLLPLFVRPRGGKYLPTVTMPLGLRHSLWLYLNRPFICN